jgi:hypothetical protein
LCWSLKGKVSLRRDQSTSISIEYTDASKHRPKRFVDSLDLSMASLGNDGVVFANKPDLAHSLPSTIVFRSNVEWTRKNEWQVSLPLPEAVTCTNIGLYLIRALGRCLSLTRIDWLVVGIATADTWAAVASSLNTVRIFSISGVLIRVLSVPGPIVCMCAAGDCVVIAYHRAAPFQDSQCISLITFYKNQQYVVH